ncbi:hypothetical protein CABS01_04295 [Colletotrichum abscissum]|uniref:uncharacterized protein n=1 Tax=Colletotrichum abscissum TaxID=1671311 RepID=UPI0027D50186|nr:uncharacterized protein CABS01_04295 [Colletotrichum abscissum]KAI3545034.1 hypothetical protein CSPX01_05240 [Colletotrichum filicis]KAK1473633.1 hypothetical protein CABS01_04295 [Colletotrichum abscissum]
MAPTSKAPESASPTTTGPDGDSSVDNIAQMPHSVSPPPVTSLSTAPSAFGKPVVSSAVLRSYIRSGWELAWWCTL